MNKTALKADILLIITSIIWGFAFVAQRAGMDFIGPFTYNGIRFALGSLSLLPLIGYFKAKKQTRPEVHAGNTEVRAANTEDRADSAGEVKNRIAADAAASAPTGTDAVATAPIVADAVSSAPTPAMQRSDRLFFILGSLAAGSILFAGASLQQIGLQYTTAGKAGFLTGLYVVLVPIIGIKLGHKTNVPTWLGTFLAIFGMYLLSAPDHLGQVNPGDLLVIGSAFFWAFHVLLIDKLSKRLDPIQLSAAQFAWCALFSLGAAFALEQPRLEAILEVAIPILYGGLGSVGIAYTLQVVAQRDAPPAHSSIILCLEGVFATLGGILILAEPAGLRSLGGSGLMLLGMLATQWDVIRGGSHEPG
jgi:drug/metabolite transporter (DMT)-like permease